MAFSVMQESFVPFEAAITEIGSEYFPDYAAHEDEIFAAAVRYVERECTRTDLPYVILADGMDHETIHEFMPALLTRLSAHFSCPAVQLPLDEVFAEIEAKKEEAPVITGELAALCKENVMHNKLIPHTLSSRYDLKRANDDCQAILEKYAMPIAAMRAAREEEIDYGFIDYAYTLLLQNHAHDSICGCSIDAVHGEMLTRFEKCRRTAPDSGQWNRYFRRPSLCTLRTGDSVSRIQGVFAV